MSDLEHLRPDIARAWEALTDTTFLTRAVATLHEHLQEGETVVHLVSASRSPAGGVGLLVLTGRRLFFHRRGRSGSDFVEIPWSPGGSPGTSVAWAAGWLTGTLKVHAVGHEWEFAGLPKRDGERFSIALRTHSFSEPHAVPPPWYAASQSPTTEPAAASPETTGPSAASTAEAVLDQLERLAALHHRGILDETEFATAKADVLRQLSGETPAS